MSRSICSAVVILLFASRATVGFAAIGGSYNAGSTSLTINGVFSGYVLQVEGGDPRTSVVVESAVGTGLPKKHISGISYVPISLEVSFPLAQPVLDLLGDFVANQKPKRTLLLTNYNHNFQAVGSALQANNARLTEVRFPAFDAGASKEPVRVTLVFAPESTQASNAPASAAPTVPGTNANRPLSANFRLKIGTFSDQYVSRIESFTIKQPNVAPPEFSNLVLTVTNTAIADWTTWRDTFVVTGPNNDASEKSGSLEMLNPTLTTVLFTLQFSHVGIVRAWGVPGDSAEKARKYQAELYYESFALVPAAAAPLAAVVTAPTTTPAGTAPVATAPATAAPVATPVATTPAATAPVGAAPLPVLGAPGRSTPVSGTPITEAPPVPSERSPRPAVGAAPTTDQGARDAKDFPRPEGTVRKSFNSMRQKTSVQEIVVYTSQETLEAIEESYTKSLTEARWELNTRLEDNNAVGRMHQINLTWKNGLRSVTITLTEVKTGGSEISVNLTTTTPG